MSRRFFRAMQAFRVTRALPMALALGTTSCSSTDASHDLADASPRPPLGSDAAVEASIDSAAGDRSDVTSSTGAHDASGNADSAKGNVDAGDATRLDATPSDATPSDATRLDATPSDATRDAVGTGMTSCADLPLCDDFERSNVGAPPGSPTWSVMTPNCSGTGSVVIDDTQSHSGRRSVKVIGAGGYCNHVFFGAAAPLAATGAHVFGRLFVRFGSALGEQHVTFLAMRDAIENKDLRMGGQKSILMWNRESDDATLPELSPAGAALSIAPAVGAWTCIEFELDTANGTVATWADSAPVAGLIEDGTPTADIDSAWLRKSWKPSLVDVRFGWESYGDQATTLWLDDIAVGPRRIGCSID